MTQKEIWSEIQRIIAQRDELADILHDVLEMYEDHRQEYGPLGTWLHVERRYQGTIAKGRALLEKHYAEDADHNTPPKQPATPVTTTDDSSSALRDAMIFLAQMPRRGKHQSEWWKAGTAMSEHCQGRESIDEATARILNDARQEALDMLARCEIWLSTFPEGRTMQLECQRVLSRQNAGAEATQIVQTQTKKGNRNA